MSADRRIPRGYCQVDVTTALNDLLDFGPEPAVEISQTPSRPFHDAARRLHVIVKQLDELNRRVDRLIDED